MSASREKQNRQERASSGWVDPKTVRQEKQRREEKRAGMVYAIVGVLFVAVAAAAIIYRSNIIPKMSTAATIDGQKYSAGETDFYFQNTYRGFLNNQTISYMTSYLGLDTSASLKDQIISEEAASMLKTMGYSNAEKDETWYSFFLDDTLDQMEKVQAGLKKAAEESFVYPESVQSQHAASMNSLKNAAQASGISVKAYLANNFGPLITEKIYSEQILRLLQFEAYSNAYRDGLTYSDSDLEEAYKADPNSYDKADYEYVSVSGSAPTTTDDEGNTVEPTEAESAAALEKAKTTAEQLLADFKAGGSLETLAEADDTCSYLNVEAGSFSDTALTRWVFDNARKDGDAEVLESGTTYYVAVFHDKYRQEYNTIDVRHILVTPESGTLASDDEGYEAEQEQLKAAAKAKAEDLLAQWQSGEATEASFAALAQAESADGGSQYNGGLYTQVTQGQMVETFNDWCFDASRKSGDTGIVETNYGYHVMYFVGTNLPAWQSEVRSDLASAAYTEWEASLTTEGGITRNDSGLKYVG